MYFMLPFLFQSFFSRKVPTPVVYNTNFDSCQNMERNSPVLLEPGKRLITISPGGYKGFYTHGICVYIKENYDLTDFVFSGASAGSWNALFMTCKKNISLSSKYLVEIISTNRNLLDIQKCVKKNLLELYTTEDFDLDKLFIGVTVLQRFHLKTFIYSHFCHLEDAIDCCFASSHIPFLTGKGMNTYKNYYSFDGGFSSHPYLEGIKSDFHISGSAWEKEKRTAVISLGNLTGLFCYDNLDANQLLLDGYTDAQKHKSFLDDIFLKNMNSGTRLS